MPIFIDLHTIDHRKVCVNASLVNFFGEEANQDCYDHPQKHVTIDIDGRQMRVRESYADIQAKIYEAMQYAASLTATKG